MENQLAKELEGHRFDVADPANEAVGSLALAGSVETNFDPEEARDEFLDYTYEEVGPTD